MPGSGPTNPSEAYFDKGLWGYDGSQWRKLQLVFGYYDRWAEGLGGTKSGDGTYVKSSAAVPAGYVYVVQGISLINGSGARGPVLLHYRAGAVDVVVGFDDAPLIYQPTLFTGVLVLKEGDYVMVEQASCLNGDVLTGGVCGYKMRVDL